MSLAPKWSKDAAVVGLRLNIALARYQAGLVSTDTFREMLNLFEAKVQEIEEAKT
jgi:hypothetical protein